MGSGPFADAKPRNDVAFPCEISAFKKNGRHLGKVAAAFLKAESDQPCRSKRSRFITLVQAATKSLTNFSLASALA